MPTVARRRLWRRAPSGCRFPHLTSKVSVWSFVDRSRASSAARVCRAGALQWSTHFSVVNTFFGVLIITMSCAGLAQIGAQEPTRRFVTGCVILASVILDVYRARLATVSENLTAR